MVGSMEPQLPSSDVLKVRRNLNGQFKDAHQWQLERLLSSLHISRPAASQAFPAMLVSEAGMASLILWLAARVEAHELLTRVGERSQVQTHRRGDERTAPPDSLPAPVGAPLTLGAASIPVHNHGLDAAERFPSTGLPAPSLASVGSAVVGNDTASDAAAVVPVVHLASAPHVAASARVPMAARNVNVVKPAFSAARGGPARRVVPHGARASQLADTTRSSRAQQGEAYFFPPTPLCSPSSLSSLAPCG